MCIIPASPLTEVERHHDGTVSNNAGKAWCRVGIAGARHLGGGLASRATGLADRSSVVTCNERRTTLGKGDVLNLIFRPEDDGTDVELRPYQGRFFDVEPLGWSDFETCLTSAAPSFPLRLGNARAMREGEEMAAGQAMTASAQMSLPNKVEVFGLTDGGWLPLPLGAGRTVLLDRNVVSDLQRVVEQSKEAHADSMLDIAGLGQINPMLYALEGNRQRMPTEFALRSQLSRAHKTLSAALPSAEILKPSPAQRRGLYRLLLESAESRVKKVAFLREVAPLISQPVSPKKAGSVEAGILQSTETHGVGKLSMCTLAVLSCLYDNKADLPNESWRRPGRAVIKPKQKYDDALAHNALSDLMFLDLLANIYALYPGEKFVLYTRDRGLAAFWAALEPTGFSRGALGPATGNSELSEGLLPALGYAARMSLLERLSG